MRTQIRNAWESLQTSYWFIPTVMVVGAAGLSAVTQELDSRYQFDVANRLPGVFEGGPDGARSMLATIAGSMITAAAVTFSITIAALATASSQFGPRLLRIFMRDTGSQVVLGTFVGTFIYCLLVLRLVPVGDDTISVPHFSTTTALILAVISIGVLIYFIHHMASMLQVANVASRVGEELLHAINGLFPDDLGWEPTEDDAIDLSDAGSAVLPDVNQKSVAADRIGYIQAIDEETLMETAISHDVVIRVVLRPGAFVIPDTQLAVVWPSERATQALEAELQDVFLVGPRRTPFQDIELYFDELIEIALRALSPGINDPYTAFTCIDWLTAGITSLARFRLPSRYRKDGDGTLRVIADGPSIELLLDHIFDRIRNVAGTTPSVVQKLLDAAEIIAPFIDDADEAATLRKHLTAIGALVRASGFAEHERRELDAGYTRALAALNVPT